jgi:hypothetical protein
MVYLEGFGRMTYSLPQGCLGIPVFILRLSFLH